MHVEDKIFVAGHRGLLGSALVRSLRRQGYQNLLLRTHDELDLADRAAVARLFDQERPAYVLMAAAHVGGILANQHFPVEFLEQNLRIQDSVIDCSYRFDVRRLLFLGSSCIYPRDCPQPIREEYLLTGPLETSNRAYAVAKIAGIEQCWAYNRQHGTTFLAAMPCNLYGGGDNYDLKRSHVLPALLRKMTEARVKGASECRLWGTGAARREFLISDDCAEACIHVMNLSDKDLRPILSSDTAPLFNIGSGEEIRISDLAQMIASNVGYHGYLRFDANLPDGTPRKVLDCSRIRRLGWSPQVSLKEGVQRTYLSVRTMLEGLATLPSCRDPLVPALDDMEGVKFDTSAWSNAC